jgi:protein-export membrane protein SecD/preprotein translocase SecF subunit
MRKTVWISIVLGLAVVCFLTALILPLTQGKTPIRLGLDLAGGLVVHYRPDFSSRLESFESLSDDELLGLARDIIHDRLERRLRCLPEVVVRSDQQIVVSIPGGHDTQRVLDTVGRTYHLSLRLVESQHPKPDGDPELFPYQGRLLELAPAQLSGHMLDQRSIKVVQGDGYGGDLDLLEPMVAFRFEPPHDQVFAEMTASNVGRQLAILIDDEVQWVGVIANEIDGVGTLRGGYSREQALEVATMLRSGSLPLSLEVASVAAVGPSLGQELQRLGGIALALSFTGLCLLLGVAYGHRPWMLVAGLLSLAFLVLGLTGLAALGGFTLDLAGIAGLILSIGMGMDAFLIVFEKLEHTLCRGSRDQERTRGEGLVQRLYAFAGEGRTLLHANATTLLVVLLLLRSERLHSFALFLVVGIAASLLTIVLTRQLLQRLWRAAPTRTSPALDWLRRSSPGVFRFRRAYLALLLLGIVTTVALLIIPGAQLPGLELGADFRPGSQLVISADSSEQLDAAVDTLRQALSQNVRCQRLGDPETPRALLTISAGKGSPMLDLVSLQETIEGSGAGIESLHAIDARASALRVLQSLAVLALSFVCLALYLVAQQLVERLVFAQSLAGGSRRARLLVFAGVLTAVICDLGVILMVMALFGLDLNLPVVAAMLTIVGYSVNDSVVLWSHIQQRWSQRHQPDAPSSALEVVSSSVDRVLSRAVLTSLSTMVPALTILGLGMTPLIGFAWVIVVGTAAGTCSSLFIVGSFAAHALAREARPDHAQAAP